MTTREKPTLKAVFLRAAIAIPVLIIGLQTAAGAQPKFDSCSGVLTEFNGTLVIRAGREGICIFSAEDERKIVAICSKGHRCEVAGLADLCRDSGECVEVSSIVAVRDVTLAERLRRGR